MIKNKGKILLTTLLVLIFATLFTTMAFALEGESITITFYTSGNKIDTSMNKDATIDGNEVEKGIVEGQITLLGGQTLELPASESTVEDGKSFNWRTADGQAWEAGTPVTFYEDTDLYPITAINVSTAEELRVAISGDAYAQIKLMEDIYLDKKPDFKHAPWGVITILLNGKTLEINSSLSTAWGNQRAGTRFYGSGTVEYLGEGLFMDLRTHSQWGADCARLLVGRGVTLNAPNAVLGRDTDNQSTPGYPYIEIFGTVNCKTVLEMKSTVNRIPRIDINEGAQLTISEYIVLNSVAGNEVTVNIKGGTIKTTTQNSFFNDSSTTYNILGGSFIFANGDDVHSLNSMIDITKYKVVQLKGSNGITYSTVIPVGEHDYQKIANLPADCNFTTRDVYRCEHCSDDIWISYGEMTSHKIPTTPNDVVPAKKEERGWNLYICSCCSCTIYEYLYYDSTNDPIKVIVDTGSGEIEVETIVKNVLEVDQSNTLIGIKAFETTDGVSYTLEQIVGIHVPVGISSINISTSNEYVKEIILDKYLNADVVSLVKLTKLETITIDDVISVKFGSNCTPTSLKSIVSEEATDDNRAEIEFAENAFSERSNLTEFTFVSNADYIFGKRCFYRAGIKSVVFSDNCTVTFKGEQAFYESKVEYLYVGKGITEIANKPFDCAYYLQEIILMDVTKISTDYSFCLMNKGEKPCVIYHHADSLSINRYTFHKSHGVTIYTKAAITNKDVFDQCAATTKNGVEYPAYTIHYGISHEFEEIPTEPTCTSEGSVKYITTCVCGVNDGTAHKVFYGVLTNSSEYTIEDYTDKVKEKLPHDIKNVEEINYVNGYTKNGYGIYKCSMCQTEVPESSPSCAPLVKCLGYSVPNADGTKSITVKYVINKEMLDKYEQANGVSLDYGVVIVAKSLLDTEEAPLDENGAPRNGAIKYQVSDYGYTSSLIKLSNIGDEQKNDSFVMCTYIVDGDEIYYIQDNETVNNPSGVSYTEIKELADYMSSLSLTTVSTKDE